jgi:spore germination cell wall hydrolase CwlJ-like protein
MLKSIRAPAMTAGAILAIATATSSMAADAGRESMSATQLPAEPSKTWSELIDSIPVAPAAAAARELTNSIPGADAAAYAQTTSMSELIEGYGDTATRNSDQECIAAAVYFEARGEPIEGQRAVAEVVRNRARSGRYPSSICAVVTQPGQFSFVRNGMIPPIPRATVAWRKAMAIAQITGERLNQPIGPDVLWYHANYVSPAWDRQMMRVTQIGNHIFYSAGS